MMEPPVCNIGIPKLVCGDPQKTEIMPEKINRLLKKSGTCMQQYHKSENSPEKSREYLSKGLLRRLGGAFFL